MAEFSLNFTGLADTASYTNANFTKKQYSSADAAIVSGVLHAATAGYISYRHTGEYAAARNSSVVVNFDGTAAQVAWPAMLAEDGSGYVVYLIPTNKLRVMKLAAAGGVSALSTADNSTYAFAATDTIGLDYAPDTGTLISTVNGTPVKQSVDASYAGVELKPGIVLYLSGGTQTPRLGATALTVDGFAAAEEEFTPADGNYFVSATGSDSADGSAATPWATLAHARATITTQATVIVGAGTYPKFIETVSPAKPLLMFKAAPGTAPVISGLSVAYPALATANIVFNGIEFYTATDNAVAALENVRNLTIIDSNISADRWSRGQTTPVDGLTVDGGENVRLYQSRCESVMRAVKVANSAGTVISRNALIPTGGSAIQYLGGNTAGVLEYNYITGATFTTYPTDPLAYENPHQSGISIRSSDITIRYNQIHNIGTTAGIMCYDIDAAGGEAAYRNILFEGNLLYDIINGVAVRIYNLGENIHFKNNFITSHRRLGASPDGGTPDARYRYETALIVMNISAGYAGSGLILENNILAGLLSTPAAPTERDNLIWSYQLAGTWTATPAGWTSTVVVSAYLGDNNHPLILEDGTVFEAANDLMFETKEPLTLNVTSTGQAAYLGDDFTALRSAEGLNIDKIDYLGACIAAPTTEYDPLSLWAQIRTATAAYFKAAPLPVGNSWVAPHTAWTTENAVLPLSEVVSGPNTTLSAEVLNADGSVVGDSFETAFVAPTVPVSTPDNNKSIYKSLHRPLTRSLYKSLSTSL